MSRHRTRQTAPQGATVSVRGAFVIFPDSRSHSLGVPGQGYWGVVSPILRIH